MAKLRDNIKDFVIKWNYDFPVDYWWRNKHRVPFGSEKHRSMSLIDMAIEYWEEKTVEEMQSQYWQKEYELIGIQVDGDSNLNLTQEEIDNDYDDIDLEQFDKLAD